MYNMNIICLCVYIYIYDNNHGDPHKTRESQTNQTFNTIFMDFSSSIFICEIISVSARHVICRICKQSGCFINYVSLTLYSLYRYRYLYSTYVLASPVSNAIKEQFLEFVVVLHLSRPPVSKLYL